VLPRQAHGGEFANFIVRPRMLRFPEYRLLRKIFGSKKEEVRGELRRLRKEVLCDQHTLPNISQVMKSRKMRWTRHLEYMGDREGAYCVLVGRPEERPPP